MVNISQQIGTLVAPVFGSVAAGTVPSLGFAVVGSVNERKRDFKGGLWVDLFPDLVSSSGAVGCVGDDGIADSLF
jgi:hypothetical protein